MYKIINTLIVFPNASVEFRSIPHSTRYLHPLSLLDYQFIFCLLFPSILVKLKHNNSVE